MVTIKNVKTLDGQVIDFKTFGKEEVIDAESKLLLIPGLIDPHFVLGNNNWEKNILTAIHGGITTILDLPLHNNNDIPLEQRIKNVKKCLSDNQMPIEYFSYFLANGKTIEGVGTKKHTVGLFLHSPKEDEWMRIFQIAAWEDLPLVINLNHSDRNESFLEKGIHFAENQNTRLYVLNVSTESEMNIIKEARKRSLLIYCETTVKHLNESNAEFLWNALKLGIIETIGTGYSDDEADV